MIAVRGQFAGGTRRRAESGLLAVLGSSRDVPIQSIEGSPHLPSAVAGWLGWIHVVINTFNTSWSIVLKRVLKCE